MDPLDKAISGAASAALRRKQKRDVSMLAHAAWVRAGCPGIELGLPEELRCSKTDAMELYRHEQQQLACGKRHLTACTQADFPVLMAHFLRLCGRAALAENWLRRGLSDPRRQARAVLERQIAASNGILGNARAYAAAIARSRFKVGLDELSPRQLWILVFDLRRATSRKRHAA